MVDRLDEAQLAKLIEISNPEKDPKTGEYILGYNKLAPEKRDVFRKQVEELLKDQELDAANPKSGEVPCAKRPIPAEDEHERAVQEMLREFESWI